MKIDYGPLKSLFDSEDISEIMVNAWNKIFVEHKGTLIETSARFVDERQYQELLYSILSYDKKSVESSLSFDGILPQGHRYNLTLPPLSLRGATLTVRKFSAKNFNTAELIKADFFSEKAAQFLTAAVEARLNIVISGGTGSGKTSFLNYLGSFIPANERIVTIEDVAELRLNHPNWISLQAVQDQKHKVSSRSCLVNALRMRPNRIIIGECRQDEAFDMLQAMNTGHEGSLTTVHSNSTVDCLSRLESLVPLAGLELPLKHVRTQISQSIDLIVHVRRMPNGKRQIMEIIELTGIEGDVITRSPIFARNKQGYLDSTGYVPQKLKKINAERPVIHPSSFEPEKSSKKIA